MTTGPLSPAVVLMLAAIVHSAPRCDLSVSLDCVDIFNNISGQSGVYNIYPSIVAAQVYCDMETDGGKWTVIQRRMDGTVNFYRPWDQYKAGFGNASGEYWLGLENMYILTKQRSYELRVDMEDFEGNQVFVKYSSFSVGSDADGYKLTVTGFKDGGGGDSLLHVNGDKFTTFDNDQDNWAAGNCGKNYGYGGFWFNSCFDANPNGVYEWGPNAPSYTGVLWKSWKGYSYSLKAVAMKIRSVS